MATLDQLFDDNQVDRVSREARSVNVARLLLKLVAVLFVGLGRSAGYLVHAVVWCAVAIKVGYRDVRPVGGGRGPA
jgi:hypothetical protein